MTNHHDPIETFIPAPGARAASIRISAPRGEIGRALLRAMGAAHYPPNVLAALDEAERVADEEYTAWQKRAAVMAPQGVITHEALIHAARRAVLASREHLQAATDPPADPPPTPGPPPSFFAAALDRHREELLATLSEATWAAAREANYGLPDHMRVSSEGDIWTVRCSSEGSCPDGWLWLERGTEVSALARARRHVDEDHLPPRPLVIEGAQVSWYHDSGWGWICTSLSRECLESFAYGMGSDFPTEAAAMAAGIAHLTAHHPAIDTTQEQP